MSDYTLTPVDFDPFAPRLPDGWESAPMPTASDLYQRDASARLTAEQGKPPMPDTKPPTFGEKLHSVAEMLGDMTPNPLALPGAVAGAFDAGGQQIGKAAGDYQKGNIGGTLALGRGIFGAIDAAMAPVSGGLDTFVAQPVTQATGSPEIGQRAADAAALLDPLARGKSAIDKHNAVSDFLEKNQRSVNQTLPTIGDSQGATDLEAAARGRATRAEIDDFIGRRDASNVTTPAPQQNQPVTPNSAPIQPGSSPPEEITPGAQQNQPLAPNMLAETPASESPAAPGSPNVPGTVQNISPGVKTSATDTTGLAGMGGGVAEGITGGMYDMLHKKVMAGDTTELGKPSALLQVAKAVKDANGDLPLADFKNLAQQYAQINSTGPQYQQDLQNLVASFAKPALADGAGTPSKPVKVQSAADIDAAVTRVNPDPTLPQIEAGNYSKGHINFDGLPITIENPKGSVRTGQNPDGSTWESTMPAHYGYIKGAPDTGDGNVDVFVGDQPPNGKAFVIDQHKPDGSFDEPKVIVGVNSVGQAAKLYHQSYDDPAKAAARFGGITEMSTPQLKDWLKNGDVTKPSINLGSATAPTGAEIAHPSIQPEQQPWKPSSSSSPSSPLDLSSPQEPASSTGSSATPIAPGSTSISSDIGRTIPEAPETLAIQQNQVLTGKRPAVLYPVGTPVPALPEGLRQIDISAGTIHFNPAQIKPRAIVKADQAGALNEVLGLGPVSKNDAIRRVEAGEKPIVVTERTPEGIEIKAAAGTDQTAAAQVAALEQTKQPGNTIQVETPEAVLADRKSRVAAARKEAAPRSLIKFLQEAGGVRDQGGDLKSMGMHRFPGLIRKNGMPLDRAREAAAEAGYLGAHIDHAMADTTINDLKDAMDRHPTYSVHDLDRVLERDSHAANIAQAEREIDDNRRAIHDGFREYAVAQEEPDHDLVDAAAHIMQNEGKSWDDALEAAAVRSIDDLPEAREAIDAEGASIPWRKFDEPATPTAPESGKGAAPTVQPSEKPATEGAIQGSGVKPADGGENPPRTEGQSGKAPQVEPKDEFREIGHNADGNLIREDGNGVRSYLYRGFWHSESVGLQRTPAGWKHVRPTTHDAEYEPVAANTSPTAEPGAEGKPQTIIPGAERISDADLARRDAEKPLAPKVPQKDAGGMFDEANTAPQLFDKPADANSPPTVKTDVNSTVSAGNVPNKPKSVVEAFRDRFLDPTAEKFATIIQARKFAKDLGLTAPEGTSWHKLVDETVEHALVLAARYIADDKSPERAFASLVDLYNRQPRLGSRTSASVAEQAYSTPAPLAYVASRLAGIDGKTTVLEPTAGNGMLLMQASPKLTTANEINPIRNGNLTAQGFKTKAEDAAAADFGAGKFDVVIANPPFGAVKDSGDSKVFDVAGLQTTQIDHAISLKALESMKPDGRAVLIIGGIKAESQVERAKGYMGKAKRTFFHTLLNNYNVSHIFTVSGDLYERQGAGWPVDVIVIDGKGKSALAPLTKEPPQLLHTWDEVGEQLNAARSNRPTANGVAGSSGAQAGAIDQGEPGSRPGDGLGGGPTVRGEPAIGEPESLADKPLGSQRDNGEPGPVRAEQHVDAGAQSPAAGRAEHQRADFVPDTVGRGPVEANDAGQVPYRPASKAGVSLNTLIPANLRSPTSESLDRVQREHGQIDHYVAHELGYDQADLGKYFSAEQVDAIALGISNIEKGDGFIIGDQTGIGKGRIVAAMIRYAAKKGMTPVFVTEKPDLYGDMWRDLHDIGWDKALGRPIQMTMTNSGPSSVVPLDEEAVEWIAEREQAVANDEPAPPRRGQFTTSQTGQTAQGKMDGVLSGAHTPDVIFTTYDQMNSVKGEETARRNFLRAVAPKAFLIMDEAHNAGGQGETLFKPQGAPPRSKVFREAIDQAKAVMYSSATYAKSPKVMDLFSRTDMAKAVEKPAQLPDLIANGGVPLQQIVSGMLARSGQYLRRERSFEGVSYDAETAPVDEHSYSQFTKGLRGVYQFDRGFSQERKEIAEELAAQEGGGMARDGSIGEAGATATEFGSVMHNVIGQMILAIKSEQAGKRAVEALKAGEKPVIALAKTNESFIKDFTEGSGLKSGDQVDLSFANVLKRYLERSRRITISTGGDEKKHVMIPLRDMSDGSQEAYRKTEQLLEDIDMGNLPISPIDAIRNEIEKAGYSVREVTGRSKMLDYSAGAPTLTDRPKSEIGSSGKRVTIKAFNDGKLDAVVLNRSGSTGVSMHASSKFKDQRKRRMIIVESDPNIDTHMQMIGRVHRTGQVVTPAYTQLAADIPAEVRPTANLMRKMASLNANTTGAKKSKFSTEAVDFMNKYGDQVATTIMLENPELNEQLGNPVSFEKGAKNEGAIAKVTGHLTLLEPKQQQELIDQITNSYAALISRLDAEGANDLEAKSVDLQARVDESSIVKAATGPSPFQGEVRLDKASVKSQGRSMEPGEVIGHVEDALKIEKTGQHMAQALPDLDRLGRIRNAKLITTTQKAANEYLVQQQRALKDPDAKAKAKTKANETFARWKDAAEIMHPGATVSVQFRGQNLTGVVVGFDQKDDTKNPTALSSWTVTMALPDSARSLGVPLSQVYTPAHPRGEGESGVDIGAAHLGRDTQSALDLSNQFDKARKEGRENRYIFSGNILAAFDQTHGSGQIVNHTMEDGSVRPGIMMNRGFDPKKFMETRSIRFKTGSQVAKFLDEIPEGEATSTDGIVTVRKDNGGYEFDMPSAKGTGGKYYADRTVRDVYDGWEKKGARMRARLSKHTGEKMIDALMKLDAVFETREHQDKANAIINPQPEPKKQDQPKPKAAPAPEPDSVDAVRRQLSIAQDRINAQVLDIQRSTTMSGDEKDAQIESLTAKAASMNEVATRRIAAFMNKP